MRNQILNPDLESTVNFNCPIDAANRCSESKVRVYDILTEMYGPPIYRQDKLIVDDHDGDDDDGDDDDEYVVGTWPAGIVGAVIVALLLLALLCCLLALCGFLFLNLGGDDDKFNARVVTSSHETVDEAFGQKDVHEVEEFNRVEFPDIDPQSRLSVT